MPKLSEAELHAEALTAIAIDIRKAIKSRRKQGKGYKIEDQAKLSRFLCEAKRACWYVGTSYQSWIKKHIRSINVEQAKWLAMAGGSPDPEQYIRDRNAKMVKAGYQFQKKKRKKTKEAKRVKKNFDKLTDEQKEIFINHVAFDQAEKEFDDDTNLIVEKLSREHINDDF